MSEVFTEILQEYLHGREWQVSISLDFTSKDVQITHDQESIEMFVKANCNEFKRRGRSAVEEHDHRHYRMWKASSKFAGD